MPRQAAAAAIPRHRERQVKATLSLHKEEVHTIDATSLIDRKRKEEEGDTKLIYWENGETLKGYDDA